MKINLRFTSVAAAAKKQNQTNRLMNQYLKQTEILLIKLKPVMKISSKKARLTYSLLVHGTHMFISSDGLLLSYSLFGVSSLQSWLHK